MSPGVSTFTREPYDPRRFRVCGSCAGIYANLLPQPHPYLGCSCKEATELLVAEGETVVVKVLR